MLINSSVSVPPWPLRWDTGTAHVLLSREGKMFIRTVFLFCGRGAAADAFCWDLRLRRSLLAARPHRGFCGEEPHGAGARSFWDRHQSGIGSDSSETRYLERKMAFYLFSCRSVRENALITGCAFLLGEFI